jgi:hypothetical protein
VILLPGHDKPKCGAKKRQGEGTCKRPSGWGTDHAGTGNCKLHGGNTPAGRMGAANQQARKELARLDVDPVGDPLQQLATLAGQVLAWRDSMAAKVNDLSSLRYQMSGENGDGGEQLRAEVALWERALDRCERVLTAMARLNIDERLARISEQQAERIERALRTALTELGLGLEEQDKAARSVGRHLRAV